MDSSSAGACLAGTGQEFGIRQPRDSKCHNFMVMFNALPDLSEEPTAALRRVVVRCRAAEDSGRRRSRTRG
jgi:hypothetical protein